MESYKRLARDIAIAGIEVTWDHGPSEPGSRGSIVVNGAPLRTNAPFRHDGVHVGKPYLASVADSARGICFVLVVHGVRGKLAFVVREGVRAT